MLFGWFSFLTDIDKLQSNTWLKSSPDMQWSTFLFPVLFVQAHTGTLVASFLSISARDKRIHRDFFFKNDK